MRLPRRIAGLLLATGMAVGITTAAAPAHAAAPYLVFHTTIPGSPPNGLCLEADPGVQFVYQVATQTCDPVNNRAQQWLEVTQGGIDKWVNQAIGWCLYTDSRFDGSPIALWDCNANISNTRWAPIGTKSGFTQLQSRISGTTGLCLTVPGGQVLRGLWMELLACAATDATHAQTFFVAASA